MNTENVRLHILETAKPLILGKGFTAVGLSEILGAANVPKGSFYHYFKSKEGFGEALLDQYFSSYFERLSSLLLDTRKTGAQRLLQYWDLWLDCQAGDDLDSKCLVVKLAAEVSDLSETMRTALQQGTNRITDCLADCIRAGQQDGSLPDGIEAQLTAQSLYSLWLGATLLSKVSRKRQPLEIAMQTTRLWLQLET